MIVQTYFTLITCVKNFTVREARMWWGSQNRARLASSPEPLWVKNQSEPRVLRDSGEVNTVFLNRADAPNG